jgi:hypothetical protein
MNQKGVMPPDDHISPVFAPGFAEQVTNDRGDARLTLLADAVFYRRCTHQPRQVAGECRPWQEAYERDLAAFKAKYGDPPNL